MNKPEGTGPVAPGNTTTQPEQDTSMTPLIRALEIRVPNTAAMETELAAAVDTVRQAALTERRCGILITRHGPGKYTVSLSDDVPFGLTRERDAG